MLESVNKKYLRCVLVSLFSRFVSISHKKVIIVHCEWIVRIKRILLQNPYR